MLFSYSTGRQVVYQSCLLTIVYAVIFATIPFYIVYNLVNGGSYKENYETSHFFVVGFPGGGIYIDDTTGFQRFWTYGSLILRETNEVALVPTYIEDRYEVEDLCVPDEVNGTVVACSDDSRCKLAYDQFGYPNGTAFCQSGSCVFEPVKKFCTQNLTSDFPSSNELRFTVTARITCNKGKEERIFSNYNRGDETQQPYYSWVLSKILNDAGLDVSDETFLRRGADIKIEYNWACDLNKLTDNVEDRYSCPIAEPKPYVISKTSSIFYDRVLEYGVREDGIPFRRSQTLYGIRLRFIGTGGCEALTFNSVVNIGAGATAITMVATITMGIVTAIFHWCISIPPPTDRLIYDAKLEKWIIEHWDDGIPDELQSAGKKRERVTSAEVVRTSKSEPEYS